MGYIYLITNTVNGKRYVGQSICDDINIRWNNHKRLRSSTIGQYLLKAYQKYGIENFKFQIICICFDSDCDAYETEYIHKYNTLAPNGYNIKEGGKSSKHHPNTIELMRTKAKEWWVANREGFESKLKGRKFSDSQKQRLRDGIQRYWSNMNPEEKDKKLQEMSIRNKNKNRYKSEESRQRSLKALEEYRSRNHLCRQVAQYTSENVFVKEYKSISEATNITGICRSTISKVCNGDPKYHTAGGFLWKFVPSSA